jgi:putative intracellular protease/amidase
MVCLSSIVPTSLSQPEFAHPYDVLAPHTKITVASPAGGAAPLDPASIEASKDDVKSQDFLKTKTQLWEQTETLSSFIGKAADFDALFYVGGHGPMFDLATDAASHQIIAEFHDAGKIISAVCHGPAAISNAKLSNGKYLIEGQAVTGFSNSEEIVMGLMEVMPFSLEDQLTKNSGGKYEKSSSDWEAKVVVSESGRLITGQNPASAQGVGEAILKSLQEK